MILKQPPVHVYLFFLLTCILLHTSHSLYPKEITILDTVPKREFRGVWVATVNNIDWPSKAGLNAEKQQKEFMEIVKYCKDLGMNALIVQIRSSADAYYESKLEPWSHWLTGKQGEGPKPYYDPLQFMIKTCHKYDMEFHAWINPFRSVQSRYMKLSEKHIFNTKPEWHFNYNGMRLLDPGIPAVRSYLLEVIGDIIKRYEVDAIHFDDYFYPYPVAGEKINDLESFKKYNTQRLSLADWRRENINIFIYEVCQLIKKSNKPIKFGVSPPGIWRNNYKDPEGSNTKGLAAYDDLYADSRHWVKEGWIDYIIPQIYWNVSHKIADYQTLIDWWQKQKSKDTQVYIGHAAYKIADSKLNAWQDGKEINRQVKRNREKNEIMGSAFFSANSLIKNHKNFAFLLKDELYNQPALRPESLTRNPKPNSTLKLSKIKTDKGLWLHWRSNSTTEMKDSSLGYLLYRFPENIKEYNFDNSAYLLSFLPKYTNYFHDTTALKDRYNYFITSYNKFHNESNPAYQLFEDTTQISINNVVVGLGKAQIDAAFQSDLLEGNNRIVLNNLPPSLIDESLSIEAPKNTVITALKIVDNPLNSEENIINDSLLNELNNNIFQLYENAVLLKDSLQVLRETEEILKKNNEMSPENTSIESIKELDTFLSTRLIELKNKGREIERKLNQTNKKLTFLEKQRNKYTSEITSLETVQKKWIYIDIKSDVYQNAFFEISYQVNNVDWKPSYKLYYNKFNNNVSVKYEAVIKQQSGQNWENTPLSVTSRISTTYFSDSLKNYPIIFKVAPQNVSIRHSKNEKKVSLGENFPKYKVELIANVDSSSSPKILLSILDATQYEWFPGKMQVFIDNQFEKEINFVPKPLEDSLEFSIGLDSDILIKKETEYDSLKNNFLVKKRKLSERIIVQNNKSRKSKIFLKNNLVDTLKNRPSTQFFDNAKNQFNFEKQSFFWELELNAGEKKTILNTYSYNIGLFKKREW